MNFLDVIFGLMLVWGLYKGLKNGLFVELAGLVALIAGIYGAIHFSYIAGGYLSEQMNWEERYIKITAFLITFIGIVLLVHFSAKLLTKIADFAMLGLLNKVAGGIFGVVKVAVILGALLIFFEKATASLHANENTMASQSVLYTPLRDIGAFVFSLVIHSESDHTDSSLQASSDTKTR